MNFSTIVQGGVQFSILYKTLFARTQNINKIKNQTTQLLSNLKPTVILIEKANKTKQTTSPTKKKNPTKNPPKQTNKLHVTKKKIPKTSHLTKLKK